MKHSFPIQLVKILRGEMEALLPKLIMGFITYACILVVCEKQPKRASWLGDIYKDHINQSKQEYHNLSQVITHPFYR
jgi:hypothetical protein